MNKIEHLGIAVKDASASIKLFELLLGVAPYKSELVESENVVLMKYEAAKGSLLDI
jgi:methylmalonyl-CoA/ethylmalonyl-CoA epimerase